MAKKLSLLYIILVCGILITPGILWISGIKDPRPFMDNRNPAPMPAFDIAHLDPFPVKYEAWFNDHFPYRNSSIAFLNFCDTRYFHKSPVPTEVTIGTDGWLYPGTDYMEFVTGQQPLSDDTITAMINELNARYEKCKAMGAEYRLVIIPAKSAMYPEHLPFAYRFSLWKHPVDKLMERCSAECKAPVLYLLDSLKAHKGERELFIPSDSHWSDAGMYYGYRAILNWIYPNEKRKPVLQVNLDNYKEETHAGNYSQILGMRDYWNEPLRTVYFPSDTAVHVRSKENYPCASHFAYCHEYEIPYQNSDTTLPGLLVMRDSYTNTQFQLLLSAHFGRTTFIWDYWQYKLNEEIIANEKPDVVLCIMTETSLMNLYRFRGK